MNRRRTYIGGWEDMELVSNFVISSNSGLGRIDLNGADDKVLILVSCTKNNSFKSTSSVVSSEDITGSESYGLSCGVVIDRVDNYTITLLNNAAHGPCRILAFRY